MRLGFGLAAVAVACLPGCSGNEVADVAARLGCGQVDGLGALTTERPPTYILVGELAETNEAPAAFAELACQLAARQVKEKPLWVGLSEYVGGSSDAERAMRGRLDDLAAKGAHLVVGSIAEGHPTSARDRDAAESYWATTIMANVKSVDAGRALLLMPRVDGVAEPVRTTSERYADYYPMALNLPEGQVLNLEIGQANGLDAPTIRIYTAMTDGYMGQIALGKVTPAAVTADIAGAPGYSPRSPGGSEVSQEMVDYVAGSGLDRDKQIDVLIAYVELRLNADRKARIEARRQLTNNGVIKSEIDRLVADPFAEMPVTQFPAIARDRTIKAYDAWEKRKERGLGPPFGAGSVARARALLPRDLVNLVEKELGYVPN